MNKCVKILLSADKHDREDYFTENGLHQTILDISILSLLKSINDGLPQKKINAATNILKTIYDSLGYERKLTQSSYVRRVTELLIQQTVAENERMMEKAKEDPYFYYSYFEGPKGIWTHTCNGITTPTIPDLDDFFFNTKSIKPSKSILNEFEEILKIES